MDVDLMKLLRQQFIIHGGHVRNHLQGNKAGQYRQNQTFLCEDINIKLSYSNI